MGSLRDKILNAQDITSEIIDIPEWGVQVEVRAMSGKERGHLYRQAMDQKGKMDYEKAYPIIVIASAYDPITGERVFEPTDSELLNTKNVGALEKIAKVALKLSGLEADSVENAEKNS